MNIFYPPEQEKMFLVMLILGVILGCFYDVFRIKRSFFGNNIVVLFFDDLLFSLASVLIFLFTVFVFNNGHFRWFEVFFLIIGFCLYIATFSRLVLFVAYKAIDCLRYLTKYVIKVIFAPLRSLMSFILTLTVPLLNSFTRTHRKNHILRSIKKITSKGSVNCEK